MLFHLLYLKEVINLEHNIGKIDRIIRFFAGIFLILSSLFLVSNKLVQGIFMVLGIISFVEGIIGHCYLYQLLKINTCVKDKRKVVNKNMKGGEEMKLDLQKFSLAAALTMGFVYVLCAIFVALWPGFALQLFGWLVHLVNIDKFAGDVQMTAAGLIFGLLQAVIYTYLGALAFAWLHNKFLKNR